MTANLKPRPTLLQRLRDAIERDPQLRENLWFVACAVVALIGLGLAKVYP